MPEILGTSEEDVFSFDGLEEFHSVGCFPQSSGIGDYLPPECLHDAEKYILPLEDLAESHSGDGCHSLTETMAEGEEGFPHPNFVLMISVGHGMGTRR